MQGLLEGLAPGIIAVIDHLGGDAGRLGPAQPLHARNVGNDQADFRRVCGGSGGVDEGLQVCPASGDQDGDPQPGHLSFIPSIITAGELPARLITLPIGRTVSPAWRRASMTPSAFSGATAATMPMPQLKVR